MLTTQSDDHDYQSEQTRKHSDNIYFVDVKHNLIPTITPIISTLQQPLLFG